MQVSFYTTDERAGGPSGLDADGSISDIQEAIWEINVDLKVNDEITVRLKNNYNTYFFGGKKTLVLSTASWIGGNNTFLGYAYVFGGGLCIFLGFLFTLLSVIIPRKLGVGDLN